MDTIPEIAEGKPVIERLSGGIEISNVSFRYHDGMPNVLDNLSLQIRGMRRGVCRIFRVTSAQQQASREKQQGILNFVPFHHAASSVPYYIEIIPNFY
jgi:hypothetical protein